METAQNAPASLPFGPGRAKQAWLEWIGTHGGPRPDRAPRRVLAAFADPVPSPNSPPPPRWLCATLMYGEPLLLRRPFKASRGRPELEVITRSGRGLGAIVGGVAELIEAAVAEGILPQVSAIGADPDLPPAARIQLCVEFVAWLAPGEPLAPPAPYDEDGEGAASAT